jgi:hypothetical protein
VAGSGALDGGLPEPLPAMPYALVATEGRLFAGLADGQLWESNDRGDSWHAWRARGRFTHAPERTPIRDRLGSRGGQLRATRKKSAREAAFVGVEGVLLVDPSTRQFLRQPREVVAAADVLVLGGEQPAFD